MRKEIPSKDDLHYETETYVPKKDANGKIDTADILWHFQNLAGEQVEKLDIGEAFKAQESFYYVVVRIKGYFIKQLSPEKTYTMVTYPMQASALQMVRYMYLVDDTEEIAFYLISVWVLLDQATRRLKITRAFQKKLREKLPDIDDIEPLSDEHLTALDTSELTFVPCSTYQVVESDIDRNGHMNNTRYVAIAQQCLKDETFSNFEINFEKECFVNETITLSTCKTEEGTFVKGVKEDETVSFVITFRK